MQLDWFYQLEGTNVRNWEELAAAFYKQYHYNADLALTRTQLQSMSMGTGEGFKTYAQNGGISQAESNPLYLTEN